MRKNKINENYLEKIPSHKEGLKWSKDDKGIVTLEMENKGAMKRITQIILRKPKVSYIHLEELGSFIWQQIDGEKDIIKISEYVDEHFGEKANPLYERLAQYFQMLERYDFITLK